MAAAKKQQNTPLTRLELEIMQVLWKRGSATVQQVLEELAAKPIPAYTTIQTILTVLYRKGKVTRTLKGKAYEYSARVSEQRARGVVLRDIVERFFKGSAEKLVMALVQNRQLSTDKLSRLAEAVTMASSTREGGE